MDLPSSLKSQHPDVQLDDRMLVSSMGEPSTAAAVSMFSNADNTVINNSSFSITINNSTTNNTNDGSRSSAASPLALLYQTVAPNAICNAGGRADEVRCYPGTRTEVIGLVEKFIAQGHNGPRMLWLSGPAGAGKSAIMQTVAEQCEEKGVPQANFFFFRGDNSRSDASRLVATLMHQIIKLYPLLRRNAALVLEFDPLIFRTDLRKQFNMLIHQALPINQDSDSSPPLQPLTLLIDGLDECDSQNKTTQQQLLQALDTLLVEKGLYFRVVVASRIEPQISMVFKQLRSQVDVIFLDEQYSPEKDIHLFVTAEFDKVKSTHYLAHTLDQDWPSELDISGIVSKSSGQFIYAATVMQFIKSSPASPILSLQKVQGIVPLARNSPFAYLDALYSYILEQVDDLEAVKCIFAFQLLAKSSIFGIITMMHLYQPRYSKALFDSCISELTPIICQRNRSLEFFHASFPDFLLDKSRARQYYVDLNMICATIFPTLWAPKASKESFVYTVAIEALKQIQQPTHKITTALMTVHPDQIAPHIAHIHATQELIGQLHRLYDPQLSTKIVHKWMSASNPETVLLFSKHVAQCDTCGRKPEMCSMATQETYSHKHATGFIEEHLHHFTGKGK